MQPIQARNYRVEYGRNDKAQFSKSAVGSQISGILWEERLLLIEHSTLATLGFMLSSKIRIINLAKGR
jgi:hypothetical protein